MYISEEKCQVVKNMSSSQKKISDVKKLNTCSMEKVDKKKIDIIRLTHININFHVTYYGNKKPLTFG